MTDPNLEGAKKKVERLKKVGKNKNFIKSPFFNDPTKNPCIKEENASRKCWFDKEYDTNACKDYYENYTMCMKFWNWIEWERRFNGIEPYLPPPEERPKIIEEKMRQFRDDPSLKIALFRGIFSTSSGD